MLLIVQPKLLEPKTWNSSRISTINLILKNDQIYLNSRSSSQ